MTRKTTESRLRHGPAALAAACLLVPALAAPPPAAAQFEQAAPSDEGVEAIRTAIKRGIADFAESLPDDISLALDGPVDVGIRGERYSALIPPMSLRTEEDGDEYDLSTGAVTSSVEPLGDNRLTTVIDLPESILARRNGEPVYSVDWATRLAHGTFSADLGFAETLQVVLDDIAMSSRPAGQDVIRASNAALEVSYGQSDGTRVDGSGTFSISDLLVVPPDDPERISLAELALATSVAGLDHARYRDYEDLISRLPETLDPLPADQARALAVELADFIDLVDGFSQTVSMRDFRFSDDEEAGGLSFGKATLGAAGLTGQQTSLDLSADLGTFDVPVEPEVETFMPHRSQFDVSLVQLPTILLRDFLREAAAGLLSGLDAGTILQSMPDQAAAFLASDAALDVHSLILELEDSALFANGRLEVNSAAAFGSIGAASIRLVGLDNLAERLRSLPQGSEAAAFLAFIQAMGRAEEGSGDVDVRRYELEMTADGRFLLNGADMGPIIQQFF